LKPVLKPATARIPGTRLLVLVLVLLPLLAFGALAVQDRARQQPLLAEFQPEAVAEIELSHGDQSLLLRKRAGIGPWEILSAADAPGDAARIGTLLDSLARLEGRPIEQDSESGPGNAAPVEVRLAGPDGTVIARLAFWSGHARRLDGSPLDGGPLLAVREAPLLPLWASPWSNLRPPKIDSTRLARAERITPEGLRPLDDGTAAAIALVLGKLTAVQFVPAFDLNWTRARMLRLTMLDGTRIDAMETTDAAGRIYLRFESPTDEEVRAVRRFAFRTAEPLP